MSASAHNLVKQLHQALADAWGAQHWWPAATAFEVVIGAFLTQNTAWKNVELAIANLRSGRVLDIPVVRSIGLPDLEEMVRPSGYFRQKAARLKNFVSFLDQKYDGSLDLMFSRPTDELRRELLALTGIGPETADSILLYAGHHPVFVVDTYTRRVFDRHGILRFDAPYDEIRLLVESALSSKRAVSEAGANASRCRGSAHDPSPMSLVPCSPVARTYKEMHAYIVGLGKRYCFKAEPRCDGCPLSRFLPR